MSDVNRANCMNCMYGVQEDTEIAGESTWSCSREYSELECQFEELVDEWDITPEDLEEWKYPYGVPKQY